MFAMHVLLRYIICQYIMFATHVLLCCIIFQYVMFAMHENLAWFVSSGTKQAACFGTLCVLCYVCDACFVTLHYMSICYVCDA